MIKIYSTIQQDKLLHLISRLEDIEGRTNICSDDSYLQCASLKINKGSTFRPHKHITRERFDKEYTPQESWVVIKGRVRCTFYDLDDSIIGTHILKEGDISVTFYGGHTYEILEDAIVYEYKTGKYEGIERDKVFI